MQVEWKFTKYGYELIEEYSDNQIALLKQDKEDNEFYMICDGEYDTGRNYLDTTDLEKAKELVVREIVNIKRNEIKDLENQIEELQKLLN